MNLQKIAAFLLLITPMICPAQKGIVKGFVVLSGGDTIQGLIKAKSLDDYASPLVIVEEKTNEEKPILPEQIKSVSLAGSPVTYLSRNVTLDLSYIDPQSLVVKSEGFTVSKVLLLQKIYTGTKLDLYHYHTRTKEYYFISSAGKMEELLVRYKTYETKKLPSYENVGRIPSYTVHPFYRDQLLQYFDWHSNKSLTMKVAELPYEKNKILAIIKEIDKS